MKKFLRISAIVVLLYKLLGRRRTVKVRLYDKTEGHIIAAGMAWQYWLQNRLSFVSQVKIVINETDSHNSRDCGYCRQSRARAKIYLEGHSLPISLEDAQAMIKELGGELAEDRTI